MAPQEKLSSTCCTYTGASPAEKASAGSCSAACKASRPPSFGLGLALGVLGGAISAIALARNLTAPRSTAPEPACLRVWRRELAKTRGMVAAGFLNARIQRRYEALYAERPRFDSPALRDHLENNILPGLALYQVLCEDNADHGSEDRQSVFTELDRLQTASLLASDMGLQGRLLSLVPDPFAVFRMVIPRMLASQFPREGWDFHWVENTPDAVAFDATDCFYLRVLTAYGAPELTAHFCHLDDVLMSRFPVIAWKRTRTLGRGDPVCDFRYERIK